MEYEGEFSDLNLNKWIVDHLTQLGFKRPSPIQYNCIPAILQGKDCFGCSKTGSGKTAAFALPVLQKLSEDPFSIFCLVLTPTRELAHQIGEQFALLGKPINVSSAVVVGGLDIVHQAQALEKKPHIVIATPGRLADLIRTNSENVKLNKIRFLILDEADRLLDKMDGDFASDLDDIFEILPKERQTLLFSATLSDALQEVKELSTKKPFFWEAKSEVSTVDQLDQRYLLVPEEVRDSYLVYICNELLEKHPKHSIMIFTKTCKSCELLGILLRKCGFTCVALHSVLTQRQRLLALRRFKSSNIRLLVATDVAARGLDIPLVQVVINHNIPGLAKNYVHRVGRTARAGRSGQAISLVTQFDIVRTQSIEEHITHRVVDDKGWFEPNFRTFIADTKLQEYDIDENSALKILSRVNYLKREAELIMEKNEFGKKRKINKEKALILEGKDPEEVAKAERKKRRRRIREEKRARKRHWKRIEEQKNAQ